MENNNIEKKLYLYCLFDKEINVHEALVTGFDDKATISYYLESFKNILVSLSDLDKEKFLEKLHNNSIYRVAYFDTSKGEFVNEKCFLADLFDLSIDEIISNKLNEKEK